MVFAKSSLKTHLFSITHFIVLTSKYNSTFLSFNNNLHCKVIQPLKQNNNKSMTPSLYLKRKYYSNYSTSFKQISCNINEICHSTLFQILMSASSCGSRVLYFVTPISEFKSKLCHLFTTGDPKHTSSLPPVTSNNIDHNVPRPSL